MRGRDVGDPVGGQRRGVEHPLPLLDLARVGRGEGGATPEATGAIGLRSLLEVAVPLEEPQQPVQDHIGSLGVEAMARRQLGNADRRFKVAGQPALGQHPQREPDHVLLVEVAGGDEAVVEQGKNGRGQELAPAIDAAAPGGDHWAHRRRPVRLRTRARAGPFTAAA